MVTKASNTNRIALNANCKFIIFFAVCGVNYLDEPHEKNESK